MVSASTMVPQHLLIFLELTSQQRVPQLNCLKQQRERNPHPTRRCHQADLPPQRAKVVPSQMLTCGKSSGYKGTHNIGWPDPLDSSSTPSLTTGLISMGAAKFNEDHQEWKLAIRCGDLEKYRKFLKEVDLSDSANMMEATALENGFIPEGKGRASVGLERRMMSSLPHIAYMVSRPRQPTDVGESLLRRQDAALRPHWLGDWQCDFGGFTKVYEYNKGDEMKRMYSVAYITRPRTREANACLCFTLLSGIPKKRPWKRDPDMCDSSRSVVLDLQEASEWHMDSIVELAFLDKKCKCSVFLSTRLRRHSRCTGRCPRLPRFCC